MQPHMPTPLRPAYIRLPSSDHDRRRHLAVPSPSHRSPSPSAYLPPRSVSPFELGAPWASRDTPRRPSAESVATVPYRQQPEVPGPLPLTLVEPEVLAHPPRRSVVLLRVFMSALGLSVPAALIWYGLASKSK